MGRTADVGVGVVDSLILSRRRYFRTINTSKLAGNQHTICCCFFYPTHSSFPLKRSKSPWSPRSRLRRLAVWWPLLVSLEAVLTILRFSFRLFISIRPFSHSRFHSRRRDSALRDYQAARVGRLRVGALRRGSRVDVVTVTRQGERVCAPCPLRLLHAFASLSFDRFDAATQAHHEPIDRLCSELTYEILAYPASEIRLQQLDFKIRCCYINILWTLWSVNRSRRT